MQPAIVPSRETLKSARTSASPMISSVWTGGEHADERLLDVLGQLVDDAVGADVDALALGELPRFGVRPDVEADDERVRGRGEHDVALGDRADALVDHVDAHLGMLDLRELGDAASTEPPTSPLRIEVQVLDGAFLQLREERSPARRRRLRALRELLACGAARRALLRELAGLALVLDDARELAGGRRHVEAEDLDGRRRAGPP